MKQEIRAIETRYKGYRFRSRLEARWAVFFDALGLQWEYEPEGFKTDAGPYLPDFFIHGNGHRGPYFEVKATRPTQDEIEKLVSLCEGKGAYGIIAWGDPVSFQWLHIHKDGFLDGEELYNTMSWYLPPFKGEGEKWKFAAEKARSARFEHGETP